MSGSCGVDLVIGRYPYSDPIVAAISDVRITAHLQDGIRWPDLLSI